MYISTETIPYRATPERKGQPKTIEPYVLLLFLCVSLPSSYLLHQTFYCFHFPFFFHPFPFHEEKKLFFLVVFLCYCCPPVFCIMRPSYKKTKNLQLQKNYIVENNKLCCWRCGGGRTKNCSCYFLPCLSASFFKLKSQHAKLVPCCPPPFLRTKTGGNQFKLVKSGAHITYKNTSTHSIHSRRRDGEETALYKKSSKKKKERIPQQKGPTAFFPFLQLEKVGNTFLCALFSY